jgi:hypothetical protein
VDILSHENSWCSRIAKKSVGVKFYQRVVFFKLRVNIPLPPHKEANIDTKDPERQEYFALL